MKNHCAAKSKALFGFYGQGSYLGQFEKISAARKNKAMKHKNTFIQGNLIYYSVLKSEEYR